MGADRGRLGQGQPHAAACGSSATAQGYRVECRIPGADANPYLAFAATIAAGLHGIEHGLDPGDPFEGNGYEADDLARVPHTLVEAIELFEGSEVAREAFGDDRPPPPAQHRRAGVERVQQVRHRLGAPSGLRAALSLRSA